MSDARWLDVRAAANSSAGHFAMAVAIHAAGGFDGPSLEAYKGRMAFMHAMQSGLRSLEATLERIMAMLGETIPTGPQSHSDLIRRAGRSIEDDAGARPAIPPPTS